MDYSELYKSDRRFTRYVDVVSKEEGKSIEDTLKLKTVQFVGDMYAVTPDKELIAESNMKSGGC